MTQVLQQAHILPSMGSASPPTAANHQMMESNGKKRTTQSSNAAGQKSFQRSISAAQPSTKTKSNRTKLKIPQNYNPEKSGNVVLVRDQPEQTEKTTSKSGQLLDATEKNENEGPIEEDDEFAEHPVTPRNCHSSMSPRCEAFVMTGEKIFRLNSKISTGFAEACQDQLPPCVSKGDLLESSTPKRGPFDDFPSVHHKTSKHQPRHLQTVPNSQSAHALGDTNETTNNQSINMNIDGPNTQHIDEGTNSCITVNALCQINNASNQHGAGLQSSQSTLPPSPSSSYSQSIPSSPAKYLHTAPYNNTSNAQMVLARLHSIDSTDGRGSPATVSNNQQMNILNEEVDRKSAQILAKRLFELDGFKKSGVAKELAKTLVIAFYGLVEGQHWWGGGVRALEWAWVIIKYDCIPTDRMTNRSHLPYLRITCREDVFFVKEGVMELKGIVGSKFRNRLIFFSMTEIPVLNFDAVAA